MITKFKLFETNDNNHYDYTNLDVPQFVIDYYDSNKEFDDEDYKYFGQHLINYVDEEDIMKQEKDSFIENYGFDEYEEYYKQYIQATYIHEKYVDLDIEDYEYEYNNDSEDFKKETTKLRDFIEDEDGDSEDFLKYVWEKIHGSESLESYLLGMFGQEDFYDYLKNCTIDYEELDKDIIDGTEDEEKMRYYIDEDDYDKFVKLIEEDKENVVYLYDCMNDKDTIFDETEYQELYIKEYMKLNGCDASYPIGIMIEDNIKFSDEILNIYKNELEEYRINKKTEEYDI